MDGIDLDIFGLISTSLWAEAMFTVYRVAWQHVPVGPRKHLVMSFWEGIDGLTDL